VELAAIAQPNVGAELHEAVAALWSRFRQANLERVQALADAAKALRAGALDDARREAARRAAHKLAGAAGTFGYLEGSRLARQAEQLLNGAGLSAEPLEMIVAELQRELARDQQLTAADLHTASDGAYVLIVDDDEELGVCLEAAAQQHHLHADHVTSVDAARLRIAQRRPDVLVLDLTFEGGVDASLALLAELSEREPALQVQVLVLTARGALADRVAVAERGAVAFLQKPASPAQVMDAITQILNRERTVEARVLIVDDDPLVLGALEHLLAPRGYRITTLDEPSRFWDVLEESPPDLVLLDVEMPGLTGIDLCRALRTDLRWAGVPVLFLTAHGDADTIQKVFGAGADDYVAKPVIGPELVTRVANRLERTQLHRRLAETDVLTGLANRQKADQSLRQLLRLSGRHQRPTAVGVIDLDFFKDVNDRFGHATGDAVLRKTAEILSRCFRRDDVVGRWGGEEFVVGMYGMSGPFGQERLNRALESLQAHEFEAPNGEMFRVSFSAGVAEYPSDGADAQTLFRAADAALYRAKAAGRGQVL
jgi:diguanylate cyclase (GGDEF)-like protein